MYVLNGLFSSPTHLPTHPPTPKCIAGLCVTMLNLFNLQLVWLETPTNPLMTVVDIQKAADVVHQYEVLITL